MRTPGNRLVRRKMQRNVDVVTIRGATRDTIQVTARPRSASEPLAVFEDAASVLRDVAARPVFQLVFGANALHEKGIDAIARTFGAVRWPVTWIDGGTGLLGTQITAVTGGSIDVLESAGRVVGVVLADDVARQCYLGGVVPADPGQSRERQARATFELLEAGLRLANMEFGNVVRTWFYLDDILAWYDDFNAARWDFFSDRGIQPEGMPASTGIGAANPAGTALVGGCIAVKATGPGVSTTVVRSPLQCPASEYRSSFSRAAELQLGCERRLFVSGTASINPDGDTAHLGDLRGQIALTMEVVQAILESRKMDWGDVARAIAYFPRLAGAQELEAYYVERGVTPLPAAVTQGVVCREDLLFEVEVDAVQFTEGDY